MGTQCTYAALLFRAVIWIAFLKKEQSPLTNRMCVESFFLLAMLDNTGVCGSKESCTFSNNNK